MPLNVFKAFGASSRSDGEGFFPKGFRRQDHSDEDSLRGSPSIRRQVLTKKFRRNNQVGLIML